MKKSSLILFITFATPALVISQSIEQPNPAPAPLGEKPGVPGDPRPPPEAPPVPAPVPIPEPVPLAPSVPMPAAADPVKPREAAPVPLPTPDLGERGQGKGKGKDQGKGKDKSGPNRPALTAPARSPSVPRTKPPTDETPPVPAEKMKRSFPRPAEGEDKTKPLSTPLIPAPATVPAPAPATEPAPAPGDRPRVPSTQPRPSPAMPERPPGVPAPAVTTPPATTTAPQDWERDVRPVRPDRSASARPEQRPPSEETARVLEDQGRRDRKADAQQAEKIQGADDAKRLLTTILGGAVGSVRDVAGDRPNPSRSGPGDRARRGYRPSVEEVGRTQQDRERNIGNMVQRFRGRAPQPIPTVGLTREQRTFETLQTQRHTQFYEGNRRVVRYSSMQEIPPIIVASQRLDRVQVVPLSQSAFTARPQGALEGQYYNEVPASYTATEAYAVSYSVDPESAISRDDILFRQGSTDFADAYSYDLVIDVAEALNAPELVDQTFVIEGHASAEGDYGQNLLLSQDRAERISRELVRHGVSPERLMPVGYGEAEAAHPADAGESQRSLDRRVMVFRMR